MRASGLRAAAVAIACACGQPPADRLSDDAARSVDSGVHPPPPTAALPAPRAAALLATRHEAQQSFDRARKALLESDYRTCARHLADGADFMRTHAAEAELGAIAALQGSAKELEFFADRLSRGDTLTIRSLDRILANANRAEAQHHLTRAVAALTDRRYQNAGEEILMSVDHLERTAHDLRRPYDPNVTPALSDARALAGRLLSGGSATRAEWKRVTAQLTAELRRLCAIIDVEARACAVEA